MNTLSISDNFSHDTAYLLLIDRYFIRNMTYHDLVAVSEESKKNQDYLDPGSCREETLRKRKYLMDESLDTSYESFSISYTDRAM